MYRILAVLLGLLLITCSAVVCAEDIQNIVFYDTFESGDTSGWWAPARVGETGQKTCYDVTGTVIDCAGTGQDGDIQPGMEWPNPRFVDNTDGTVTDMLTGLVWLKDASCADLGPYLNGTGDWEFALFSITGLADGTCGLTDGSAAGDWRLPSITELQSLIDYEHSVPALSNGAGTAQWSEGDVFAGVQSEVYWSSTTNTNNTSAAWFVEVGYGSIYSYYKTQETYYMWPVRNGL